MYLTKKTKEDLFKKHGKDAKDTGSAEGQIALFTHRINHLTEHLKRNKKDYNTERALVKLVGKRRALLNYLTKKDILIGRGVIKKQKGGEINGLKKMGMKKGGLAGRLAQRGYGKARS